MSDLTELLRPHVASIERSAKHGSTRATEVITFYEMHLRQPNDPGAVGLCRAAFDAWQRQQARGSDT